MSSGLPCIIAALVRSGFSLDALPVIALLEWVAQHVWGDPLATVAARLQRVQALTRLGLLAEAASVLGTLFLVCITPSSLPGCYAPHAAAGITPGMMLCVIDNMHHMLLHSVSHVRVQWQQQLAGLPAYAMDPLGISQPIP